MDAQTVAGARERVGIPLLAGDVCFRLQREVGQGGCLQMRSQPFRCVKTGSMNRAITP